MKLQAQRSQFGCGIESILGVNSELLSGEKGDFEVVVDGKTVFSKKKLSRFPEPGEVTEILRE